ncbi:hypothetical protein [uncultured Sphingomonas sp.]|uniref:hypothetical protein n=1 Tax=uncultured Sphingomonas sp. TaxID=158754 RepID=UPI0025D93739|nr:hypothetical protein [uncultured Sphingomonas sp.]
MGKIIAADRRVVSVTCQDLKAMGRRSLKLSPDQADACATAVAAARNAHMLCGPGLTAVAAMMSGVPHSLATKWAKQHLKRAV